MITLLLFLCLWVISAKNLRVAPIVNWAFAAFVFITAIFKMQTVFTLPLLAVFAGYAIYALFQKSDDERTFQKKWFKHPLEIIGYRSFVWIFKLLPLPVLSWIGGKLLETFGSYAGRRGSRLGKNIAMIIPKHNNKKFVKRVWNNWGRVFAEGIKFSTYKNNIDKYITFENRDMMDKYPQYIITMPHTGNMGLMALAFIGFRKKIAVTYKHPSNPMTGEIVLGNYGFGNVDDAYFIPTGNAMPIVRAIKNGDILNINSDQRVKIGAILNFMGAPAKTSTGTAELARKFNLPILIAHIERTHGAHHKIVFDEFVHIPHTDDAGADEISGMQMVNDAMGRAIMQSPSEYLWMHRRWM